MLNRLSIAAFACTPVPPGSLVSILNVIVRVSSFERTTSPSLGSSQTALEITGSIIPKSPASTGDVPVDAAEVPARFSIGVVPSDGIIIAAPSKDELAEEAPKNSVDPGDTVSVLVNIGIFDVVLVVKTRLVFRRPPPASALLTLFTATLSPALTLILFVVSLHVVSVSDIVQVRLVSTSFF